MDFAIPEEATMMRQTMKDFLEREVFPIEKELAQRNSDWVVLPPTIFGSLRAKIKNLGFWAVDVPVEFGGVGLKTTEYCQIIEEQYQSIIGSVLSGPFWGPVSPLLFPALYRGSPYQKEKYLSPLISGDITGRLCQTEPEAGADGAAIKTAAVKDGDYWVINGTKTFITQANADFLYVTAVTDKSKAYSGVSVFLIDKDTPGMRLARRIPVLIPEYPYEVVFEDCRVHDRQRLDGPGWNILQESMSKNRTLLGQGNIAKAIRSLNIVTKYVQERVTFGQPLSTRQAIQWMLADSAIEIHIGKLLLLNAAWKLDQHEDIRQEASIIKVYTSETAFQILDRCIQCMGGAGLTKDFPLERWFREIRAARILGGPNEVQRMVIARNLFRGWRP